MRLVTDGAESVIGEPGSNSVIVFAFNFAQVFMGNI